MTNQEAMELAIKACEKTWNEKTCKQIRDALEQEPCEVCINRQDVFDLINDQKDVFNSEGDRSLFESYVSELSPVTTSQKTGHWITEDMFDGDVAYRCSECNELFWIESGTPKDNEYNFCPKCGARMVEPQEREDI